MGGLGQLHELSCWFEGISFLFKAFLELTEQVYITPSFAIKYSSSFVGPNRTQGILPCGANDLNATGRQQRNNSPKDFKVIISLQDSTACPANFFGLRL